MDIPHRAIDHSIVLLAKYAIASFNFDIRGGLRIEKYGIMVFAPSK
jgi:hypothetical protein